MSQSTLLPQLTLPPMSAAGGMYRTQRTDVRSRTDALQRFERLLTKFNALAIQMDSFIDASCIRDARSIVQTLAYDGIPSISLEIDFEGGLSLHWLASGRELSISLYSDGSIYQRYVERGEIVLREEFSGYADYQKVGFASARSCLNRVAEKSTYWVS